MSASPSLRNARLLNLVLGGALAGCLVVFASPFLRTDQVPVDPVTEGLQDDQVREEAVQRLVTQATGIWDSFPDPDVGRVLQPNKHRPDLWANRFGLREVDFDMPKPEGTVRVVLLGDSYVYGAGAAAEDRVGVVLRQLLREQVGHDKAIECLHLGLISWNIRAECAFLRRILEGLDPDLVLHVLISNDLDDLYGVRGFGGMAADLSPQVPERANGVLRVEYAMSQLGTYKTGWLADGLDHESRQRYAGAAADLRRLADAVEAQGGVYRAVNYWNQPLLYQAKHLLFTQLEASQVLHLSSPEFRDDRFHVSKGDFHWNALGHQRVARFLLGAILDQDLLPRLELGEAPEPVQFFQTMNRHGIRAAARPRREKNITVGPVLVMPTPDAEMRRQIHGGIDRTGLVAPYASVILAREDGTHLVLEGQCLERPILDGSTLTVSVDEFEVLDLDLQAGTLVNERIALPEEVLERDYLSVTFQASDYVYRLDALRRCVSFQLQRVAVD